MIRGLDLHCERLLVEGAGGLLSPLGEWFTFLDLILKVKGSVLVVAKNRLGVINHIMLTEAVLKQNGIRETKFVLMQERVVRGGNHGLEEANLSLLEEYLGKSRILSMPYMGKNPCKIDVF